MIMEEGVRRAIENVRGRSYKDTIMISSPGDGSIHVPSSESKRFRLIELANDPVRWRENEGEIRAIVDGLLGERPSRPVKPVIVAAGKGVRARRSGLEVPKPLAPVFGTPVVRYVLEKFRALPFDARGIAFLPGGSSDDG